MACADMAFIQSTTSVFPASMSVAQSSPVPLGVVVQPVVEGREVPVVSYGVGEVVRCETCGGYLSPFVVWVSAGQEWMCPLCKSKNTTPEFFHKPLDSTGQRIDALTRQDLCSLVYDIPATEDYIDRPPAPPTFCFLIDCTHAGLATSLCDTLEELIRTETFPGLPRTQIAFILFTAEIHLLSFDPDTERVQVISLGSTTETAFLPVPLEQLVVTIQDNTASILRAIEVIRAFAKVGYISNSGFRMALASVYTLLNNSGGKVAILYSGTTEGSSPVAASAHRSAAVTPGTLLPNSYDPWYHECGRKLGLHCISVDLFLSCSPAPELQSLLHLSEQTGGCVYLYPKSFDSIKLTSELYLSLTREQMWDVTLRLRVNKDWRLMQAYGSFVVKEGDLLALPVATGNNSVAYRLEIEEQTSRQGKIYLQAAALYTTANSERRFRVMNISIQVSNDRFEILSAGNSEVITLFWSRQAMVQAEEINEYGAGKSGVERKLRMLLAYAPTLPRSLQFLPYYVLGLVKMTVFHGGRSLGKGVPGLSSDIPCFQRHILLTWPVALLSQFLYPRLYPLTPPLSPALPSALNLTVSSLHKDQSYCLDTSLDLLVWLGMV